MAEEKFETNLLRFIAAEIYFLAAMTASREMHGKSYFSLGVAEKASIDVLVWQSVSANFQTMTQELLKSQTDQKPVGFQNPQPEKTEA